MPRTSTARPDSSYWRSNTRRTTSNRSCHIYNSDDAEAARHGAGHGHQRQTKKKRMTTASCAASDSCRSPIRQDSSSRGQEDSRLRSTHRARRRSCNYTISITAARSSRPRWSWYCRKSLYDLVVRRVWRRRQLRSELRLFALQAAAHASSVDGDDVQRIKLCRVVDGDPSLVQRLSI